MGPDLAKIYSLELYQVCVCGISLRVDPVKGNEFSHPCVDPEGVVNVILTTPMWVVNTRLKLQGAKFRNEDLHQTHYRGIFGG